MELSKIDANLLTREGVFIFISKKLGEIDPEIENEMRYIRTAQQRYGVVYEIFTISRVDNYKKFVITTTQQLSPKSRRPYNIYMVYNHQSPPTHQQPTYQQPTHLQKNFALLQLTI
jgi:hypothetical protein